MHTIFYDCLLRRVKARSEHDRNVPSNIVVRAHGRKRDAATEHGFQLGGYFTRHSDIINNAP